jgi:hypothetical protein
MNGFLNEPVRFVRVGRLVFALLFVAAFASGCATVVYKDGASTFVVAGRAVTKQLNDASISMAAAEDAVKLSRIVTDAACPIAEPRLFVRDAGPAGVFAKTLARYPSLAAESECVALLACDRAGAGDARCKSACFSRDEANCINNLERNYAIDLNKPGAKESVDKELSKDADELAARIRRVEYGRAAPLENKLVGASLKILTEYLDLLSKIAEDRKSEIPAGATNLSNGIKSVTDEFAQISGTQLSAATTAQRTKIQNGLGALGKFLGNVDRLVNNAHDAEKIKAVVNENKDAVPELVKAIKPIFSGDAYLIAALNNRANFEFRSNVEARFHDTKDPYERKQLMAEVSKYPLNTGNAVEASVGKVFDAVLSSHNALLSLINNPTDEQLKKIRGEEFDTFRSLVEDAVGVLALVK